MAQTIKYIAIADKIQGGLNIQLTDATFPLMSAKITAYELVDDGQGGFTTQAIPNATLRQRFRSNYLAPNAMYKSDITAANLVGRIKVLKDGLFPEITHRTYHIMPIIFEVDDYEEEFNEEVKNMRLGYDQATSDTTHKPIGRLLRKEQVDAFFTDPTE